MVTPKCRQCRGSGRLHDDLDLAAKGIIQGCPRCGGSGREVTLESDVDSPTTVATSGTGHHEIDDLVPMPNRRQRRRMRSKKKGATQIPTKQRQSTIRKKGRTRSK